ncbi:MAG: hypothetical protein GZ085_05825 [Sulfuriferula multivorans]|uniref:Uncharacterized protein n=1 Tax=Sulfuriferula multivorans TaxID=1559896 RepID=A0A7C9P4N1_9PROT|nr:hypothetical protein [Sulfuriferula multivorans]
MSQLTGVRRVSVEARVNTGSGLSLAGGVGAGTSVRPGRVRNRTKTESNEKAKQPASESGKKSPPSRKAPARGRYVDEYARPAR